MPNLLVGTGRALLSNPSSAIKYLLYDTFATALAAGSVNGTASEPGSNALANAAPLRTVVDTTSKLSIVGGQLSLNGATANADPSLSYPSHARTAGRVIMALLNYTTSNTGLWFTDSGAANAIATTAMFIFSGTTGISVRSGANSINVGAVSAGTNYQLCIIERATGYFYLIKGGAFTNWTMLYPAGPDTTTPLFPGVLNRSTADVEVWDNIRIPQPLYIPSPLAADTFTRANGALGSTETTGPDSQAIAALAWAFTAGIWTVASNAATSTPRVGAERLTDTGLEGNYTAGKNDNLTTSGGSPAYVQSADVYAGSKAQQWTATAQNDNTIWPGSAGLTGDWYLHTLWAKRTVGSAGTVKLSTYEWYGVAVLAASYTQYAFVSRGLGTTNRIKIIDSGTSFDTIIFDDGSIKQLTLADLFSAVTVSTQDVIADVAITAAGATASAMCGLVLNLDSQASPANFVIAHIVNNYGLSYNIFLEKCVAGVYTTVISAGITYSAGTVLRVVKSGTSYSLFYNNAVVGSVSTISDAGIVNNLNHGMFNTYSGNTLDNFTLWPRGVNNEYATLDLY